MRAILVRIGIDHAYGNWNAPVDPDSRAFVYVPIPESLKSRFDSGMGRRFQEVVPAIDEFASKYAAGSRQSLRWPEALNDQFMHLDPDFEYLTYGDDGAARGSEIKSLNSGDMLVFYAGLRPIRPAEDRLIYALVGVMVVDEIVAATEVPRGCWRENAHTRKSTRGEDDIVVRARRGVSGRLARCIDIGEFRNRAYRVRQDILKAWGGLNVEDGFIQRSARPPKFLDPKRFYKWFRRQRPKLQASNFSVNGLSRTIESSAFRPQPKAKPALVVTRDQESTNRVIIVHLRQPRMSDPNETRADPFYEFGSFGCTKCHFRNLMNPRRAVELNGARFAFAQGGSGEFRLILLTPPVTIIRHKDRCEARWKPVKQPFRFSSAPLLISNKWRSEFPSLVDLLREGKRDKPCGRFSSAFRSRRTPLPDHVARQLVDVFENHVDTAGATAFASDYSKTMTKSPPQVDTDRRKTYRQLLRLARARKGICRSRRRC